MLTFLFDVLQRHRRWMMGCLCLAGGLLLLTVPAHAQDAVPTEVVVRAVSQDAKVIQDPVGGARITIRERATGRVLVEGLQTGSSGSTDKIMRQPHRRGEAIYDTPDAAAFRATIPLAQPTEVEITAEGPLDYPQAMQQASKTLLLVPGEDVTGDGIVLTLHGFIVDIETPEDATAVAGDSLDVRATVRMLCGCPTEPGGMWDADAIVITARLVRGNEVVRETAMRYAGETSTYVARLPRPDDDLELQVLAADPDRVNFGMDRQVLPAGGTD